MREDPGAVLAAWNELLEQEPGLRIREAARRLGCAEAELLRACAAAGEVTGCPAGFTVTELACRPREILGALSEAGPMLALTRNDAVVHEREGSYDGLVTLPSSRQMPWETSPTSESGHTDPERLGEKLAVANRSLGFGLWPQMCRSCFAVSVPSGGRMLRGIQFFDAAGTAVHKAYLREGSDEQAYERVLSQYAVTPAWGGRSFEPEESGGTSAQGAPSEGGSGDDALSDPGAYRAFFEEIRRRNAEVTIEVGNRGARQSYRGTIVRLKRGRGWFNILDPGFNLHIREERVDHCRLLWATSDVGESEANEPGVSLELCDTRGETLCRVFPVSPSWGGVRP
jgi:putative hemin transport protein